MGRRRRRGLVVITGCMSSGKTEHLISFISTRATYAEQKVQVFSPAVDTRSGEGQIVGKAGSTFPSRTVKQAQDILELVESDTDLVAIDEAQFFDDRLVAVCQKLMRDKEVVVAGLNTDFRGEPFGPMGGIMAIATEIYVLAAVCAVCGEDAYRTQRLVDGVPARYDDPVVLVGGIAEGYESRCLLHHEVKPPRKAHNPEG
jgi:thymidine kinase